MRPYIVIVTGPKHLSVHEVVAKHNSDGALLTEALKQMRACGEPVEGPLVYQAVFFEVQETTWPFPNFINTSVMNYYTCDEYDATNKHEIQCYAWPDLEEFPDHAKVTPGKNYKVLKTQFAHPELDYIQFTIVDDEGKVGPALAGNFKNV